LAVEDIDALIGKSKQARRSAETPPEMTFLEPVLIVRESSRNVVERASTLAEPEPV
jgi:hypothetical protein